MFRKNRFFLLLALFLSVDFDYSRSFFFLSVPEVAIFPF